MNGMLSALCGQYYKLKVKLYKRDDRFKELFDNVLKFDQNVTVGELDDIFKSSRKAVNAFDKTQVTFEKMKDAERKILHIFKSMGVRPNWFITGQIPGELEYKVWYDDDDKVWIVKTKELEPEPENPNIITIHLSGPDDYLPDEDDDED